jgi:hypothetical protein
LPFFKFFFCFFVFCFSYNVTIEEAKWEPWHSLY